MKINNSMAIVSVASLFVAVFVAANPAAHGGAEYSAGRGATAASSGTKVVTVKDPIFDMTAYTYTIPSDWIFEGAAVQGSSCGGGVVPVFRANSPDGLTGVKALPRLDWAWSDNANLAAKTNASDCLPYKSAMSAQDFLKYMFGVLHVNFVKWEAVPWLAQRQKEMAAQNTPSSNSTIDIAIATVHYNINKIVIEEQIQANVRCGSNLIAGSGARLNSCNALVIREWAPLGKFNAEIYKPILHSFTIDQEWQSRYTAMMVQQIKDRAANARAMLDQREAAQNRQMQAQYSAFQQSQQLQQKQHDEFLAVLQRGTDMSMQRTADSMNAPSHAADDWCDYSLDQQKRLDPNTGLITKDSSAYNYTWVNEQGDRVQTNNINANPNGNGTGNWTLQENVR